LYALSRLVRKHARLLAVLESLDAGTPIRRARDRDLPLADRGLHRHAGWAELLRRELPDAGPVGIVAQLLPSSAPLLALTGAVAPALAAGNAVVLQPDELTPLTALLFVELCREAGLPPGVVGLVTGDAATGEALVRHPDVDGVAFIGSTETGRLIRRTLAGSGKELTLTLGGPIALLVFDDADLDSAVEGVVEGLWLDQGRVGGPGGRILAQEGVAEALAGKLRARMETLRAGDALDRGVDMGPVVGPARLEEIRRRVAEAVRGGARVWQPSWNVPEKGWFYPPTLCTDVFPATVATVAGIPGPVASLTTFRTHEEALDLVREGGLLPGAAVWSESVNLALDVATRIEAGTVWVNAAGLREGAASAGGGGSGLEGLRGYVWPRWQIEGRGRGAGVREGARDGGAIAGGGREGPPDRPGGVGSAEVPDDARGRREDVMAAVDRALEAGTSWRARSAHDRGRVLHELAEELEARGGGLVEPLAAVEGDREGARREVDASVRRLFAYGAWAETWK
ncbi:MAG TPA: aldehyde dehydrogenase family protein, partial [Longimicrobiales bacterium]|nr:aldehyde dehydrogenase family protein [Longimicrobiales bacterium]